MRIFDFRSTIETENRKQEMDLLAKISARKAKMSIVGLGYAGLPLAVEFARAGFRVTGIDSIQQRTERINRGESYILDVSSDVLESLVQEGKLYATIDYQLLKEADTVNICVPTPLNKAKDPDISL